MCALWRLRIVPLWIVMLAGGCVFSALAYRAEANEHLRPWSVLGLWVASMAGFVSSFLVGLTVVVCGWRRIESALLLAWLVLALVGGGVLLVNTPESHHFVTLAPLICLLMALGLDLLGRGLERVVPALRRDVPALTAIVVATRMAWNLNFYFREYTPRRVYGFRAAESATAISEYITARPGRFVYFFGPPFAYLENGTIAFVARTPAGLDVLGPMGAKGLPVPPGDQSPLMIFYPPRAGEAAAVSRRYPGTPIRPVRSEVDGMLLFVTYTPAADAWPGQAQ